MAHSQGDCGGAVTLVRDIPPTRNRLKAGHTLKELMNKSPHIIFDIETGGEPLETLVKLIPEFKAASNIKDPEKIEAAIREKKNDFIESAALSPLTGRVVAIGYIIDDKFDIIDCQEDEAAGLANFWKLVAMHYDTCTTDLIGFNSNGFDLPFLVRRSYKYGVPICRNIRHGRYWSGFCIDLMDIWTLYNREDRISLDNLSKFLGIGAKNGNGKDFARLWIEDRPKAIEYLENDLRLTQKLARKLGVIE